MRSRFHPHTLAYEDKVFVFFLLPTLMLGFIFSQLAQHMQFYRPVYVSKPYARKITQVIIRETPPPQLQPVELEKRPILKAEQQRALTKGEKKRLTSPPPLSAVGSPKALYDSSRYASQKGDIKKMVARKGLLGLLSKEAGDTDLRAYQPSKKRDASTEMATALKNLSTVAPRKGGAEDDFLGVGNLPEVAKKGSDIGYILNASKIGEVKETQVEFYGGTEDLPEKRTSKDLAMKSSVELPGGDIIENIEGGKGGRAPNEIRKIVASYLGGLRYLYTKALRKDPAIKGKITVQFEITPSGSVTRTLLVASTIGSNPLEQAILDNIHRWKFPSIPEENGAVKVTYPFVFLPPTS